MKKILLLCACLLLFASTAQAGFSDVPETDSHYHSIRFLQLQGIVEGGDDGRFRPNDFVNRAELIKMLVEGLEHNADPLIYNNCFPDVETEWFARYICYAQTNGWVDGYPDGTFKPERHVNKVEALKIVLNAFGVQPVGAGGQLFDDVSSGEWYEGFLSAAKDKKIIEEWAARKFSPVNSRTRGEMAEMIARVIQLQFLDDPVYSDTLQAEFQNYVLLHDLREANGVNEVLKLNPLLAKVAREHAKDMAENLKAMSHGGSDGRQSYDRIKEVLPENFEGRTGENLGRNTVSKNRPPFVGIKQVHDNIFMPEPKDECNHRTTLLSECLPFSEVGVGVYVKDNWMYFVNDFITTKFAKALRDVSHLEIPIAYTGSSDYEIEQDSDNYTFVKMKGCDGKQLRAAYFVQMGVYFDDGLCRLYSYAYHLEYGSKLYKEQDVVSKQVATLEYTSSIYDDVGFEFDEGYIKLWHSGKWRMTNGKNTLNLPLGASEVVTFQNGGQQITLRFNIGTDGWIRIDEL